MPYYPRPDAYETEGGFPYIPAQPPEGYWQPTDALRYLTRGALAGAGIHLFQRFLRRPLVSQSPLTPHLDIGLGQAGLSWYQLVQGRLQVRDVFLDLIKALEEGSPFYLGRTFGLTELLSPYVIGRRGRLHIPYEVARTHHRYYAALTSRPGFALEERHYARGLLFLEGKLYGLPQEGEAIELLPHARLRLAHWAPPATPGLEHPALHGRLSPITQEILARRRHLPISTLIPRSDPYPFHVVGAQSAWRHHLRELQSVFELWNRRFFRLLDDPFEFLMDLGVQAEGIPLLRQGALLLRRLGLSNRFGLGGDYRGNVLQQWLRWLRPEIIRSGQAVGRFRPGALLTFIGLPFAYRALDQYLRQAEWTQETPLAEGLGGLAANLYQNAMLARAHLGRLTGLQWLARAQEELAPGSTHLATLAAFPLAGGVAGGLLGFTLARTIAPASLQPLDVWQAIKLRQYSFQGQLARFFPGKYTLTGKYLRTGLALGLLPVIPFLPGALARTLGGLRTPEEWRAIFRGEEEVEIRTGRWWEMGASFFRGQKVGYYRPHWTVLARSDYLNRALFQGDEHWLFKAAKRTPILTDIVSPYYLERQHYYDRPYPVTGPSLPGLGVMGPIYAATLGRLFKPPAEMHVEGWRLPQGYRYQREEYAPVASLGGLPPKPPVSPYSLRRLGAEAWHRWTEAIGLPGWLLRSLSGSEDWGAQGFQLASAERLTSEEREYWDKQLGGLMGLTEWYRRINVRRRTAIAQQQYAPLRNRMPSWLPGPEYFIDFLHGDPYCVSPSTLIEINELDFAYADTVKCGDRITTHRGRLMSVKNKKIRNVRKDEKVFELRVASLTGLRMQFSEEHPILVMTNHAQRISQQIGVGMSCLASVYKMLTDDGKIIDNGHEKPILLLDSRPYDLELLKCGLEWVKVKDLKPGQYVAYPRPQYQPTDIKLDLAELTDYPATRDWIYISDTLRHDSTFPECYEWLEQNEPKLFRRGERKRLLEKYGWKAKDFKNAQAAHCTGQIPERICRQAVIDKDIAYAMGLYLAEGWLQAGMVCFALRRDEEHLFQAAVNGLLKIHPKSKSVFDVNSEDNRAQARFFSRPVEKMFRALFGTEAHAKKLPSLFIHLKQEVLGALLKGYIDGDDCSFIDFSENKGRPVYKVSIKSCNLTLLLQFRKLLLSHGIIGSIVKNKAPARKSRINGKEVKTGVSWSLHFRGSAAHALARLINDQPKGLAPQASAAWSFCTNDYVCLRVLSVEEVNDVEEVIGFEIPEDDSFCVAGIATHNTKIPQGEARLPGPGYAALHPELKGVPAEEYPLLYRLRILTDVAPWAETTQMHWELATRARRLGLLQAQEEQLYRTLEKRWRKLKRRREFHERRQWSEVHLFKRPFGRLWEKLSHRAEFLAPQESLLPLRPLAKFVHQRDPLEDYLLAQVLGADRAFWDRPIAHFLRPALDRFRFIIDPQRIPPQVQARRRIEAYFDRLRYLKARLHEAKAREAGDLEAARAWRQEQLRTMVGAEPVGTQEGLLATMAALPRAERDYFPYFARETDPKRQEAILAAVPPDVGRIYRLIWSRQLLQRLRQVERREGAEAAEEKTTQLQEVRRLLTQELATGGRLTPEALEEWQREPEDQRLPLEEWLRLQDVVEGVEEFGLPAPESIFWDPRVDVEDAKLKFVLHEGLDMHDFELWASRERLLPRKPYLRSIVRELQQVDKPEEIRHQVYQMLSGQGIERLQITVLPGEGPNEVQLSYDGTMELGERLERLQYAQQRPVRRLPPPSIRRTRSRTRQRSERPL